MKFKVIIRKNDRAATHIVSIKAGLSQKQADQIRTMLNAAFASQGLQWFAQMDREEDD